MKSLSMIACCVLAVALSGCSSSTSVLNQSGLASIGGGAAAVNDGGVETLAANAAPAATGSIGSTQAPVALQPGVAAPENTYQSASILTDQELMEADEEDLTPEERHRRELINRGDLEPGQSLPTE